GLEHAEADDRPHVDPQLLPVVRHDRLVDHAPDHPDERDLRSLRTAGQHDRDDQRDLVRLQEAEQPRERSAIENRLRHYSSLAAAPAPLSRPRRAWMRPTAVSSRARFAGTFSQRLTPQGAGSGTTWRPSRSGLVPMLSPRLRPGRSRRMASPPTATISSGRSRRSSHSNQNEQSSRSSGAGTRSPSPDGDRPG